MSQSFQDKHENGERNAPDGLTYENSRKASSHNHGGIDSGEAPAHNLDVVAQMWASVSCKPQTPLYDTSARAQTGKYDGEVVERAWAWAESSTCGSKL
ncbi:hypothetical protein PQX77_010044 [Marasmius sp. AFHP31]|nr:hypothetical protein PQX77_010044 [Marasmius sp. AFHP31]